MRLFADHDCRTGVLKCRFYFAVLSGLGMARIRLNCGKHEIRPSGTCGTDLQHALDARVPQWIAPAWPFTRPRYIGRDLSWADWLALPDVDPPRGG